MVEIKKPCRSRAFNVLRRSNYGLALGFGLASGVASGLGLASDSAVPTISTVTRRFGARHSMSCLRFILLSQNLVTGIGCLNALPSQKITFWSTPVLTR